MKKACFSLCSEYSNSSMKCQAETGGGRLLRKIDFSFDRVIALLDKGAGIYYSVTINGVGLREMDQVHLGRKQ